MHPQFAHVDCPCCVFVGRSTKNGRPVDVYTCNRARTIYRYSSDESDYESYPWSTR